MTALDLARQSEGGTARAPPPSRWFVGIEVVVDRPPGRTGTLPVLSEPGVVGEEPVEAVGASLQRLHPHHHGVPARANALVCPMSPIGPLRGRFIARSEASSVRMVDGTTAEYSH